MIIYKYSLSKILIHYYYSNCCYIILKIFIQALSIGQQVNNKLNIYRYIEQSPTTYLGRNIIRMLLDIFYINGPQDKYQCLVYPLLQESVLAFLYHNPVKRLPLAVIAVILYCLFLALDYLYIECLIVYTGLQPNMSPLLLILIFPCQISRLIILCLVSRMNQSLLTSKRMNFSDLFQEKRLIQTEKPSIYPRNSKYPNKLVLQSFAILVQLYSVINTTQYLFNL